MKIAVNTRLLLKDKLEGIGWFEYETLKRITQNYPEHKFLFFFDRPYDEDFIFSSNVEPHIVSPQARHPFLYYIWFEMSLRKKMASLKPDLFISPDGYISLGTDVKTLAVIHDLNFEYYPENLPWLTGKYYRHYFPQFARKSQRIATVSEFSKNDLITKYLIDPGKIDVVYNGSNTIYQPVDETEKVIIKDKYTYGCNYFLFIGALHPRKNIVNLFKAFDLFKNQYESDIKLLIVGERKWWTDEISAAYANMIHREEVIFTGRLETEELKNVLGSAFALTYVSLFEGFGIPIIEAMSANIPVITSNVTSMPEVSADAAILVDPFSIESIANGMTSVTRDKNLRKTLIEKGEKRAKDFSWDKTAAKLWNSIIKTVE